MLSKLRNWWRLRLAAIRHDRVNADYFRQRCAEWQKKHEAEKKRADKAVNDMQSLYGELYKAQRKLEKANAERKRYAMSRPTITTEEARRDSSKRITYILQCNCEPMVEHCDGCDSRRKEVEQWRKEEEEAALVAKVRELGYTVEKEASKPL